MKKPLIKFLSVLMIFVLCLLTSGCDLAGFLPYIDDGRYTADGDGLTVHFIDVGQGDCILLESGGHYALIDGGEYSERYTVTSYLSSVGVKELDYIIATHPHSDHCGGLAEVIRSFDTAVLVSPKIEKYSSSWEYVLDAADERSVSYDTPKRFETYSLSDATITVLSPDTDSVYSSLNNYSIVCMADYMDTSFLFMGDAEKTAENELLKLDIDLSADVIKCGHHGSSTSSSKAFIEAVDPSVAVICCGKNNDYGHPHKETLSTLNSFNITTYRTDTYGTIVMHSDGKNISMSTANDSGTIATISCNSDHHSTDHQYIGNKNSKVFHSSDCSSVSNMKDSNRVYFDNRKDAIDKGFSPCQACNP